MAEQESQHWLIGRRHTRIHYAKGPLVPWNDSSGSASRRAVVWIGIYVHPRWHYLHGVLNWLCKPFLVLLLIAPPIYWFAGMPAFETDYLSFLRYGVPALLGQIIYMAWISRSRTLPFFMEATHAVTAFAITATLISAVVKPFGRPFKITDKGGDRSAPRGHLE